MDDLADVYDGKVLVYKVNTDEQRELATVFQVRSIPSILFAPIDGKPAMQPGALSKEDYIRIIDEFVLKVNKQNNDKSTS
jgi:thioredoxin-like negative regulator of GroEL